MTIVIGQEIRSAVIYQRAAAAIGVDLEIVIPGHDGAYSALRNLCRRGRLGAYLALDAHGAMNNGQHVVAFPNGDLPTLDLLRHVRSLPENDAQKPDTLIHLHTCYGAHLRDDLKNVAGAYLICGGKKNVLSRLGHNTIIEMMRMIGAWKRQGSAPYPTPHRFFERASACLGDTVSLVGRGVKTQISYAKRPEDLAGASEYKKRAAFASRINDGKSEHVRNLLQAFPWLAREKTPVEWPLALTLRESGDLQLMEHLIRQGAHCIPADLIWFGVRFPALRNELVSSLRAEVDAMLPVRFGSAEGQIPISRAQALDCGCRLIQRMFVSLPRRIAINQVLTAICGDREMALVTPAWVLRYFIDALSAHLLQRAGWPLEKRQRFRDELAWRCCDKYLYGTPAAPLNRAFRDLMLYGNVQGFRLITRHVDDLIRAGSEAEALRWLESPAAKAVQELISAMDLSDHERLVRAMLCCVNPERYPLASLPPAWNQCFELWQLSTCAATPRGDFDAWIASVRADARRILSSRLSVADRTAYNQVEQHSRDDFAIGDFLTSLLNQAAAKVPVAATNLPAQERQSSGPPAAEAN